MTVFVEPKAEGGQLKASELLRPSNPGCPRKLLWSRLSKCPPASTWDSHPSCLGSSTGPGAPQCTEGHAWWRRGRLRRTCACTGTPKERRRGCTDQDGEGGGSPHDTGGEGEGMVEPGVRALMRLDGARQREPQLLERRPLEAN